MSPNCWGTHFPTQNGAQIPGLKKELGLELRPGFWVKPGAPIWGQAWAPCGRGLGGDIRDKTCRGGKGQDRTGRDSARRGGVASSRSVLSRPVGRRASCPVLSRPVASAGRDWRGQSGQDASGRDRAGRDWTGQHGVGRGEMGRDGSRPGPARPVASAVRDWRG